METLISSKSQSWLPWFLRGALILVFLVLIGRLVDLEIIRGNYFRVLSDGNRIRRVPITAPRGQILARGGEVLVGNKKVDKRVVFSPGSGFSKSEDIKGAPAGSLIGEWVRDYQLGSDFAHVSGYLGEVSQDEVGKVRAECPEKGPRDLGTFVGRSGLEEEYDCTLAGIDGEELIEVDSMGREVRILGKKDPVPGANIRTNIDYGLQQNVANFMKDKKGAVVVTDTNGEIMALYSSPSFDPNMFTDPKMNSDISSSLNNPDLPFLNRAIGGVYHPGSVFKPVVAIGALDNNVIDDKFLYDDPGVINVNSFSYSNWYFTQYGRKEGQIGIVRALARSTDTFFYNLGGMMGIDLIDNTAKEFGYGQITGIDLPGEVAGLVPTPDWKLKVQGEKWFLGNTYHVSIGQGDLILTPLQVNSAISSIASNGMWCSPEIVRNSKCQHLPVQQKSIDVVKEGMKQACSTGGTGFTFFDFKIPVACKTGTAQTEAKDVNHAWFTAFGPFDSPEIISTVLVEKGGEGSVVAGPIERKIFDYWFYTRLGKSTENSTSTGVGD